MTRDEIESLERALQEASPPDEGAARERARRTVLSAHADARPRRRFTHSAPVVWLAAAALLAAVLVTVRDTGPARAFENLVRDIVHVPAATPAPTAVNRLALPAPGRLLVTGSDGLFVVARDGRRTSLGRWQAATWSPSGLYVAATSGRTLAALDPDNGTVRWRLRPGGAVAFPRWAPDRTHIAYRAGTTLRIVYGNGIHDVLAGRRMAAVAPAWHPAEPHTIAWAASDGKVTVEDADTAKVLWTRPAGGRVQRLAWSADGRRLLIAGRRNGAIHDLAAGTATPVRLPAGSRLLAAAFAPTGTRLALAVYAGGRTEVRVQGETLLQGSGRVRDLEWSPDGRWLLASFPAADQWQFTRASARPHASAIAGVTRRFGTGTRTHGWCC